jgi:hypothetical protein
VLVITKNDLLKGVNLINFKIKGEKLDRYIKYLEEKIVVLKHYMHLRGNARIKLTGLPSYDILVKYV